MTRKIATLLGAALLCGTLAVQAQTQAPPASGERAKPTPEQHDWLTRRFSSDAFGISRQRPDEIVARIRQIDAGESLEVFSCHSRIRVHETAVGRYHIARSRPIRARVSELAAKIEPAEEREYLTDRSAFAFAQAHCQRKRRLWIEEHARALAVASRR